ncbi:hypothetical protein [Cryocola sp. 340MFSha3.1]|uniref:hypothetical protein n=1 Tax=Cryocola sp. 340MFSha3.1 TaxID=1169145 RepID=UPI00037EBDBD|nr:hypothetical protein [Cryocola sp. 340MFSha3.1]
MTPSRGLFSATLDAARAQQGLTGRRGVQIATEDWQDKALGKRIDRAARELVVLMESEVESKITDTSWDSYQHEFGSAGGNELGIDLGSDLMRLAAGGTLPGTRK